MNTIHIIDQLWQEYSAKCYPDGVSEIQARECKQAFAAGMVVAMEMVIQIADTPDGISDVLLRDFTFDVMEWCKIHSVILAAGKG